MRYLELNSQERASTILNNIINHLRNRLNILFNPSKYETNRITASFSKATLIIINACYLLETGYTHILSNLIGNHKS